MGFVENKWFGAFELSEDIMYLVCRIMYRCSICSLCF